MLPLCYSDIRENYRRLHKWGCEIADEADPVPTGLHTVLNMTATREAEPIPTLTDHLFIAFT